MLHVPLLKAFLSFVGSRFLESTELQFLVVGYLEGKAAEMAFSKELYCLNKIVSELKIWVFSKDN